MKTLIAVTTFAFAALAEKLISQKRIVLAPIATGASEPTDEIRRYDIDDLILS